MYDAIIIGARCAGSPTAMLLARQGHKVLLVDRATFPSDTISTHGIPYKGLVILRKWGLFDRIAATNCPQITKITSDAGDFPLTGNFILPDDSLPWLMCPRRTLLDKILVDCAVEAGAELREGFSVREIVTENGRVVGIQGATKDRPLETVKARIVIGADGKHSLLARAVQAPMYREEPPLMCWYYTYWTDLPQDRFRATTRHYRKTLFIPTNDGLTCVLVGWPHHEFPTVRADIENQYMQAIQRCSPESTELVNDGTRVDKFYGMADLPNFFRKPYGPGWALVGDAGHHKDPVVAHGITNAFFAADILAEAVHAGLAGERPMHDALADYEKRRNDDAFPRYESTLSGASFSPPSEEFLRLRAALRHADQADIDLFYSAGNTIPRERFFSPENLDRILNH